MQQDLNIKALKNLFSSRNTTYKFLLFYSLIKLIKELEDPVKNIEIFYKQIIKEILVIAWLPSFQFNLNFNEQDKIKDYLIEYMKNSPEIIKNNKPTNKIINKISSEIDLVLKDKKILERLENDLINKDVVTRLIRPFYKRAIGIPEAGQNGWYQNCEKILIEDYQKEQPLYFINLKNKKIIPNNRWIKYIKENYFLLELFVLDEWYKYMQTYNINSPSLYEKLKLPNLKRNSLDKERKLWIEIIKKKTVKCIFSEEKLTEKNFDIDHFICWNFLGHDQEWNLIPVTSKINRSKNNKVPKIDLIKTFVDFKIKSFEYAKEVLSDKKFEEYLSKHTNFINFSNNQCFTSSFKDKYNNEIKLLANKASIQGFETFIS